MTTRQPALIAVAGGALLVVGALLPWAVLRSGIGSLETPGIEGDGVFSLGCGVLIALIAFVHLDRPAAPIVKIVILALAGLAGYVVVQVFAGLNDAISELEDVTGAVGTGIYVSGLGVILAAVGGLRMVTKPPLRET